MIWLFLALSAPAATGAFPDGRGATTMMPVTITTPAEAERVVTRLFEALYAGDDGGFAGLAPDLLVEVEPHQAEIMGRAELERHLAGCEPPTVGRIAPANDEALQIVTVSLRCSGGARGAAHSLSLEFVTNSRSVEMVLLADPPSGTAR